ncbi:MAG: hypothetical protein UU64_C0001G0070 [candidate division WWE3 bacterium GW2011_GWF2_41_45]|nr:MAG: hypothetical protein UU55_C0002G0019 [candidate division WWE3 bacterium GW2011_GWC2_41_23]KKS10801.1 MAG: hypothetical protein UU64_C0001G0070 [candidate division WWE3 bacterium GW2011_GWF2_41_45]KKS12477.1 MAG: hypothetical protein UU68_C0001G0069 [candidate division WWE3 bacterium GW2011_GWF1_41_53]KKS20144.1 MAG: hypothetical protein UU79_C0003G0017 [candidate division WWE3 bacterium GW2011_GWE1_41_72]KKS29807.1 MAG: hypothetical protein UU90_C0007G0010 [candidate division WWE3 bacte
MYYLDYREPVKSGGYAWKDLENAGYPNPLIQLNFPIYNIYAVLQNLGVNYSILNFSLVYFSYTAPFYAMFFLLYFAYRKSWSLSSAVSLLYLLNPFTISHLSSLMIWNIAPLYTIPLIFGVIHICLNNIRKLVFIFSLFVTIFSYSFANIPYLGIFHIAIIIALLTSRYLSGNKVLYRNLLSRFVLIEMTFIICSSWWLLPLFFNLFTGRVTYSLDFVLDWLSLNRNPKLFFNLLTFTHLPSTLGYYFHVNYFLRIITYIPFVTFIYLLVKMKQRHALGKFKLLLVILFILIFLVQGTDSPLGFAYILLVKYLPLFSIFKSPLEKFGLFYQFYFCVLIALMAPVAGKNKVQFALLIYAIYCSIPLVTNKFIPEQLIGEARKIKITRNVEVKQTFNNYISFFKNHENTDRILSFPGSRNYQVAIPTGTDSYYLGMDPYLYSVNHSFLTSYASDLPYREIYKNLSKPYFKDLLDIYGVGYVVFNKDIVPWDKFVESESSNDSLLTFTKNYPKEATEDLGNIEIFGNSTASPMVGAATQTTKIESRNKYSEYSILLFEPGLSRKALFFNDKIKSTDWDYKYIDCIPQENIYWNSSWRWPESNTDPKSKTYLIMKVKEFLQLATTKSPESKAVLLTWLTAKRTNELLKYDLGDKEKMEIIHIIEGNYNKYLKLVTKNPSIDTYSTDMYWNRIYSYLQNYGLLSKQVVGLSFSRIPDRTNKQINNLRPSVSNSIDSKSTNVTCMTGEDVFKTGPYQLYSLKIDLKDKVLLSSDNRSVPITYNRQNYSSPNYKDSNEVYYVGDFNLGDDTLLNINPQTKRNNKGNVVVENFHTDRYLMYFEYPKDIEDFQLLLTPDNLKGDTSIIFDSSEIKDSDVNPADTQSTNQNYCKYKESTNCIMRIQKILKILQNSTISVSFTSPLNKNATDSADIIGSLIVENYPEYKFIVKRITVDPVQQIELPNLSFKKINPTKYVVDIKNAKNNFILVFNQSFDSNWKVYFEGKEIGTNHNLVNFYANFWDINIKDANGIQDFQLVIEYYPQKFVYIGSVMTTIFILFSGVLYFLRLQKK